MESIKFRGGAKIGKIRTSWPFVTLTVRKDRLEITLEAKAIRSRCCSSSTARRRRRS